MIRLEESFKAAGWKEITRTKKGTCQCGGDIVMFWGTVSVPYGPSPKRRRETRSHGPVCEKCGIMYSPFVIKS